MQSTSAFVANIFNLNLLHATKRQPAVLQFQIITCQSVSVYSPVSVHDLSLLLLGPDHQDRFPGRHREAVSHQGQAIGRQPSHLGISHLFSSLPLLFHVLFSLFPVLWCWGSWNTSSFFIVFFRQFEFTV